LIIANAKTSSDVLANPVGPDIMACGQFYPQHFRHLQSSQTRRRAPIANGYSTGYNGTVNYWPQK
jgi:hypothetical protein